MARIFKEGLFEEVEEKAMRTKKQEEQKPLNEKINNWFDNCDSDIISWIVFLSFIGFIPACCFWFNLSSDLYTMGFDFDAHNISWIYYLILTLLISETLFIFFTWLDTAKAKRHKNSLGFLKFCSVLLAFICIFLYFPLLYYICKFVSFCLNRGFVTYACWTAIGLAIIGIWYSFNVLLDKAIRSKFEKKEVKKRLKPKRRRIKRK
jgi:hypothetical protein